MHVDTLPSNLLGKRPCTALRAGCCYTCFATCSVVDNMGACEPRVQAAYKRPRCVRADCCMRAVIDACAMFTRCPKTQARLGATYLKQIAHTYQRMFWRCDTRERDPYAWSSAFLSRRACAVHCFAIAIAQTFKERSPLPGVMRV